MPIIGSIGSGSIRGFGASLRRSVRNLISSRTLQLTTVPGTGPSYYTSTSTVYKDRLIHSTIFGGYWTSDDEKTWTLASGALNGSGQTYERAKYVYGNKIWLRYAIGTINNQLYYSNLSTSVDGRTWSTTFSIPNMPSVSEIKFLNNQFVAVGFSGTAGRVAFSSNGTTWSVQTLASICNTVAYGNGRYVIGSNNVLTYTSTNGTSWTQTVLPRNAAAAGPLPTTTTKTHFSQMIFGNNLFLATFYAETGVSGSGPYFSLGRSTDGVTWSWTSLSGTPSFESGSAFLSSSNTFVFGSSNGIISTTNGISYGTNSSVGTSISSWLTSEAYAFSSSSASKTTNGSSWSSVPLPPGTSLLQQVNKGQFPQAVQVQILIGNQGSSGAEVLAPVDVYTVPSGKTANIYSVEVTNKSNFPITYDLAILGPGETIKQSNSIKWDEVVQPSQTSIVADIAFDSLAAGKRIVVFPSSADTSIVSVYGVQS